MLVVEGASRDGDVRIDVGWRACSLMASAGKGSRQEESYVLTSQMRRAAISIPSNIAEGQGRQSPAEFGRFLLIAYGSVREIETQVLFAERLGYLNAAARTSLGDSAAEIGRLLNGLRQSLVRQPMNVPSSPN